MQLFPLVGLVALLASAPGSVAAADPPQASASGPSPVGRWTTVDDQTGKARSIIRIAEEDGRLSGTIVKLLDPPPDDPNPTCDKCKGDLKDAPILGMRILSGLRWDGSKWSGGRILDPDNGKTYKCSLSVNEDGKTLKLRGFIGFSLLGRTQQWLRAQ